LTDASPREAAIPLPILPEAIAREQPGIYAIQLTPALDPRRVALLQRRGGYRSAASRAFVDLVSARAGEGRRLGF
jgi:LysR family cyn operon transcriptional activator